MLLPPPSSPGDSGLGKTTLIRSLISTPGERLQVNEAGGHAMCLVCLMMACTAHEACHWASKRTYPQESASSVMEAHRLRVGI